MGQLLMFSQGVRGLMHSAKGSVAHVQPGEPGGGVGAYIWMLDGWELYVHGNFHLKSEMMFIGKQIETCYADEAEDAC